MNTATIKERPILFSAPMVRAIQEGRKTVTRRPIRFQPDVPVTDAIPRRNFPHGPATIDWYWRPKHGHLNGVPSAGWDFKCPYGQPGDRLWVRETWFCDHFEARLREFTVHPAPLPSMGSGKSPRKRTGSRIPRKCCMRARGVHQSICPAGPAASCWRSPTCASSGCRTSATSRPRPKACASTPIMLSWVIGGTSRGSRPTALTR
ncbi:hypothetical protein [Pseudomonas mandelii]|uniref:hypothetical protein n=1 Tax=Pseudomonas mandelii TaxID=75612 RepID=UPI003F62F520